MLREVLRNHLLYFFFIFHVMPVINEYLDAFRIHRHRQLNRTAFCRYNMVTWSLGQFVFSSFENFKHKATG